MTNPFKKASELGGGAFFKPGDHMTDLAILIEPKSISKNVQNEYQGRVTTRDEVTADVTVFRTEEALNAGKPDEIVKSARFVHGMLTSSLEKLIEDKGAIVAIVRKVPTKAGSGYAFRDPEARAEKAAQDYYFAREEAVKANLADAPSFD